ncbi:MAG: hypothetical protein HC875_24625 [Anaerolineales bacterium]|nr:hypothetical protein [Anaerolineales bacterium]
MEEAQQASQFDGGSASREAFLLKKIEELQKANKLTNNLLWGLCNELRTPITTVMGFSQLLLKGIDGPLNETQKSEITAIHESGIRLLNIINDLLDVLQIENGTTELNSSQVDLKLIIKTVMEEAAKRNLIQIEENISENLPDVWADARRLKQIAFQIIQAMTNYDEDGKITVSIDWDSERIIIKVFGSKFFIPDYSLVQLTNASESLLAFFFDPFLSLHLSQRLIKMHGGEMWAENINGGAIISFSLPVYKE